jgi:regulator of RNase E activity RraA
MLHNYCILLGVGTNPTKSAETVTGDADVAVAFGGLVFTPGDWVSDQTTRHFR